MAYPERILVVEDDRTMRLMLRQAFKGVATVLMAEDGLTGLEAVKLERPDFVITDVCLPGLNGIDLITKIRASFQGACIPIMVLTASGEEEVLLNCFRRGADDFMSKPFSLSELRMRVASIYVRQQVARDVNPLTRLPGNLVIKREVSDRIEQERYFSVAYFDIDHFKGFNDKFGFDAGDDVIGLLGDILNDYANESGADDLFVGHIGGDDFVVLLDSSTIDEMANWVFERFSEGVRRFYGEEELQRGTMRIVNRQGECEEVPLLSLSVGAVMIEPGGIDDYRKIGHVAAEVKKVAKATPGNSLFVERRRTGTTQTLDIVLPADAGAAAVTNVVRE